MNQTYLQMVQRRISNYLSSTLSEKFELRGKKYRTPSLKLEINHIYQSVSNLQEQKEKQESPFQNSPVWYPERDLNPHDPFGSTEFKSVVSTNSTIRA